MEAAGSQKPIVYQCHPEEFASPQAGAHGMKVTWRSFIPNERTGIPARWALLQADQEILFRRNQEITSYLTKTPAFRFVTVDQYLYSHPCGGDRAWRFSFAAK
jgi:hypothetical protein